MCPELLIAQHVSGFAAVMRPGVRRSPGLVSTENELMNYAWRTGDLSINNVGGDGEEQRDWAEVSIKGLKTQDRHSCVLVWKYF